MILLIDNYDSFVHNLARYFRLLGCETQVVRNDAITPAEVRSMHPQAVVLSPGPCSPAEAGQSVEIVRQLHRSIPMLGICLGHQTIVAALGGQIVRAPRPMHGRADSIQHTGQGVFAGVDNPLQVARYHSLIAEPESLPAELEVTAWTHDEVIMGIRHRELPVVGMQFHPESVLTKEGNLLLKNFMALAEHEVPHLEEST